MAIRDLTKIDAKNFRNVMVPLKVEVLKEFFENKELFFVVDYANSQIKGNMFLTYLSNLDLPCEVSLANASKQEKFDMIKTYMETRNINNSDVLKLAAAELVLTYKEVNYGELFVDSILTEDERVEFIQQNLETFKKWDHFLYSTLIYLFKMHPQLNEEFKVEEQFPTINDPNYVGLNVVQMFGITGFTELYFSSAPWAPFNYFKPQFEEYMFKGQNLFHYFNCTENTMALLMSSILSGGIKINDLFNLTTPAEG
jgi:hypothetical protein